MVARELGADLRIANKDLLSPVSLLGNTLYLTIYNDCISYFYKSKVLMNTTTVNISFQGSLLAEIDRVARTESRSRSELQREAVRLYIDRKRRWDKLFAYGKIVAVRGSVTEEDVTAEIRSYRKQKAAKR